MDPTASPNPTTHPDAAAPPTSVVLDSGRAQARIDADGGRLASLVVDGLELLVTEADRPTRFGSFPMVPWCGRLAYGCLAFDGADYDFPITSPPHANHGVAHTRQWTISKHEQRTARLSADLTDPWPFGGRVVQRFEIDEGALTVRIEVHGGEEPMPAMAGWHPWFRRHLDRGRGAEVSFQADAAYELDADLIPTGEFVDIPEAPWNMTVTGMAEWPTITWPGALSLAIESSFDHWVIFTEPEHALCIEPQSGPPNELNTDPAMVAPGGALSGSMVLRWNQPTTTEPPSQ